MKYKTLSECSRRNFLKHSIGITTSLPLALSSLSTIGNITYGDEKSPDVSPTFTDAKVAITACRTYGSELHEAMTKSIELLGGIHSLVKGKTVTIKINLTGTNFRQFLKRSVGETYMTHPATAMSLTTLLFAAGASRVRFVESTNARESLEKSLVKAGWDVNALSALGKVEYENTRNLGKSKNYAHMKVPGTGLMFSSFDLNRAYEETDVFVSLAKMKSHETCGVTLAMKNLFGITPNSLYGSDAISEEATQGRSRLHDSRGAVNKDFPGLKKGNFDFDDGWRVPRIVTDLNAARPVHLCIIDAIVSIRGGEGPWSGGPRGPQLISPGLLIAGLNAVSTDAVCASIMGCGNPRAPKGIKPFQTCDNHILLAAQQHLGTADLSQIDIRGLSIDKARCPFFA